MARASAPSRGAEANPAAERHLRRARERQRRATARRRLVALAALAVGAFAIGAILGGGNGGGESAEAEPAAPAELPRGGRSVLPEHRLVAFYGAPQDEALGALGVGTPAQATKRLLEQARAYEGERPVLPVLELLATIATSDAGSDGLHRLRQPHATIRAYLAEARRRHALLLLDVQPGRASFPAEVRWLERWLREPDVGLALDPEWHVGPEETPGEVIGSIDAKTVNAVSARLAEIVERERLPEKLFVVHQFTEGMIRGRSRLVQRPGLATVLNVDGFGDAANKIAKFRELSPSRASGFGSGFKLFYGEDLGLMSPGQALGLRPEPDLIVYE